MVEFHHLDLLLFVIYLVHFAVTKMSEGAKQHRKRGRLLVKYLPSNFKLFS